jgi:hypothetical protein
VIVDGFQVMPVTNVLGNRDSRGERQTSRKNGYCNHFCHIFPFSVVDQISSVRTGTAILDSHEPAVKHALA